MERWLVPLAALFGFLAVGLGAFGAHGLAARVTPERLEVWKTAAHYQMIHALALLGLGIWAWMWGRFVATTANPITGSVAESAFTAATSPMPWGIKAAGVAFSLGIVVFSGSLYLLVLTEQRWLGAITPLGGVLFLAGWLLLGVWAATELR